MIQLRCLASRGLGEKYHLKFEIKTWQTLLLCSACAVTKNGYNTVVCIHMYTYIYIYVYMLIYTDIHIYIYIAGGMRPMTWIVSSRYSCCCAARSEVRRRRRTKAKTVAAPGRWQRCQVPAMMPCQIHTICVYTYIDRERDICIYIYMVCLYIYIYIFVVCLHIHMNEYIYIYTCRIHMLSMCICIYTCTHKCIDKTKLVVPFSVCSSIVLM